MQSIFGIGVDIVQHSRILNNIFSFSGKDNKIHHIQNIFQYSEFPKNDFRVLNKLKRDFSWNGRFLERIYTEGEIKEGISRADYLGFFSSRFAAKEACVKALKTGFGKGVNYRQIEIIKNTGLPQLKLYGRAGEIAEKEGLSVHLSISHEKSYSVAFVIAEKIIE